MSISTTELTDAHVTPVKRTKILRLLHRALPLERKFLPLIEAYGSEPGLLSVPWGKFRLHFPSDWLADTCDAIYKAPESNNPEFFELLAPVVGKLQWGCIVDVGAAIGVYILNFRALTTMPMIAYEPSPLPFQLAKYNVQVNHVTNVELRNVACGDFQGDVDLQAGVNSFIQCRSDVQTEYSVLDQYQCERISRRHSLISVPLVRLDDELESVTVSLLKIDCEGFEYQVLQGAEQIIHRDRPYIFVELHPQHIESYGYSLSEVCDLLMPNYELEFWHYGWTERSKSAAVRFFGRYTQRGHRFPDQAAMLSTANRDSKTSQTFLLARPK